MEERQCGQRLASVELRVVLALLTIPCYLVEVNPVVMSQFVSFWIIVRVDAIEQRLSLVLVLLSIHGNDVLSMSVNALRSVRTDKVRRTHKEVIDVLLAHVLRLGVVVAHSDCERHLCVLEYLHYGLPSFPCGIVGNDVAGKYGDVGLFLFQDRQNGVTRGVASGRFRVPMDVRKLHHLELSVLESELALGESRSHNQQQEQSKQ